VNGILINIIKECSLELSNDLSIPVMLEAHQILDLPFLNNLQDFLCLWSASPNSLKVIPIYPLHSHYLVFS
jgi:hypothetical protein